MRTLILATTLMAIVLLGSIFVYNYIEDTAVKFSETVEDIIVLINDNQWEEAQNSFEQFHKDWENNVKLWMSVIGHEEIDNIEQSLTESENYIIERNIESKVELSLLLYYLEHIYLKEQLNLHNLF